MLSKKITSLQHPQVIHWAQLFKTRSYREKHSAVLISGHKLITETALNAPVKILITLEEAPNIAALERILVTEPILKKITGLENPDGFAAVIPLPSFQNLSSVNNLVILDRVSDPGNLGTLLRTAWALGWEGVAATPGSVDFFNDKALRAAKGATFKIPLSIETPEVLCSWDFSFYVADIQGAALSGCAFSKKRALILGNEGQGPSPWAKSIGKPIHIPMRQDAESLNVASAGAILLYTMRPQ